MTAWRFLQSLQNELGSRRVGTEGERRAQDWLQAQCQALDLPVELDEFKFVNLLWWHLARLLLLVGWWMWAERIVGARLLVLGSLLLLATFVPRIEQTLQDKLARSKSANVVAGLRRPFSAYLADPVKGPTLLLGAHYDTACNNPVWFQKVQRWMPYMIAWALLPVIWLFVVIAGHLCLLLPLANVFLWRCLADRLGLTWLAEALKTLASGFSWLNGVWSAMTAFLAPWVMSLGLLVYVPFFFVLLFYVVSRVIRPGGDAPGANDNGSGVAVLLELARRLQSAPPANLEVFWVWWGAEEEGLCGSRQFVSRFGPQLDKDEVYLVNLDCVGAGEWLLASSGQGLLRRQCTDPALLERFERTGQELGVKTGRIWLSSIVGFTSDHSEWLGCGYRRAVWLLRDELRLPWLPLRLLMRLLRLPDTKLPGLDNIHSAEDTLEAIDAQALAETTNVVEICIRQIDAEL